eukprot:TRINITY_DN17904_c0_g1_i1.p1 TRINITY_DN17904_c0_g1~~TRINITY_DN17904_c0_g1_i1.p1  ORF type:complete len:318 (-),score=78.67 TRINITY_DN17904_c0_g1_i1:64-969(-)
MAVAGNREEAIAHAEALVRKAAGPEHHAQVILLQELFEGPYFPQQIDPSHFALARELHEDPGVRRMQALAKELGVVIPVSFFERKGNSYFNSVCVVDADGSLVQASAGSCCSCGAAGAAGTCACTRYVYRKSHIPDGTGYLEKYYFSPGDTGFVTFRSRFATLGVGICWDQWFPEAARCFTLCGADLLLYPTAIGSEPAAPSYNSQPHWTRVMQGHAAANMIPVIASNRIGAEKAGNSEITFYGHSFIAGPTGELLQQASSAEEVLSASFDLGELRAQRAAWGLFRDRRPDLYGPLSHLDG